MQQYYYMQPPISHDMSNIKIVGNYSYNPRYCIGEGSYGKVYEGRDSKTNLVVAIKQMSLKNFQKDHYLRSQLSTEIEILKRLNHPNIVKLLDILQTANSLYIITEFCKDGDLRKHLSKHQYTEAEALSLIYQIIDGFTQLYKNGVIHRDLKPANILIHDGTFKIADFGFAKFVNNFNTSLLKSCVGSPLYMAPQILSHKTYSTKSDIWSLGIILYELIFGDAPWKGMDEKDLLRNIVSRPLNMKKAGVKLSKNIEDLLRKVLALEEKDRYSWEELFEWKEKQMNGQSGASVGHNNPVQVGSLAGLLENLRADLGFKHYLTVELENNYLANRDNLEQKHCEIYCKFQLLLSFIVKQAGRSLLNDLQDKKEKKEEKLQKSLSRDCEFYTRFYNELLENVKMREEWEVIKKDNEFILIIEGDFCDRKREQAIALTYKQGNELLKALFQLMKSKENVLYENSHCRRLLVCADYLADFMRLFGKNKKNEVKLDNLHCEKSEIVDNKAYLDKIKSKIEKII